MSSRKEELFQDHIFDYLKEKHGYLECASTTDREHHFIDADLINFIKTVETNKYEQLYVDYHSDTDEVILKALKEELSKKVLWLIIREGLTVKGVHFRLYGPKPRSGYSPQQESEFKANIFRVKKEYYYNNLTQERIDISLWLNGLPISVIELKHEEEGQNVDDAIFESFLPRDHKNNMFRHPFMYLALSDKEAKIASDASSEKRFKWFNAGLVNKAETTGEYPVEHVYRDVLSPENIVRFLEHYLIFVPAEEKMVDGVLHKNPSFTIIPRFHQLRSSKKLAEDVLKHREETQSLGKKYLINHSAGSGKTLTMCWMADRLDSLYTRDNVKVFDNIIILTDRKSLDKNIKDDITLFSHLGSKINLADKAEDLAKYLEKDRDIIVTTIHKFSHIQEKLQNEDAFKKRKVAFLIDEAHRSQDGKLAITMKEFFNEGEEEEEEELNISNQIFVAFTATPTPQTTSYFGESFDTYSELEAITEGYIMDVAQRIISYNTLYNLKTKEALPDKDFPAAIVNKALRAIAFEDDDIIQYKSEVIIKFFEEKVLPSILGKGKAIVVTSSRLAGYKYFQVLKTILSEKELPWKVLYAFSDFTHPETKEEIKEDSLNHLHGRPIEDVFKQEEYRILVVANKFQTGFDEPLLSTMFLDKKISGVNAVQTVSRLNRKGMDKEQEDICVVDFTNNDEAIFEAFNKYRKGSPYKSKKPNPSVLQELYDSIIDDGVFSREEIEEYIKAYIDASDEAKKNNSTPDAILSNLNIGYRQKFKEALDAPSEQNAFVSKLRRFTDQYYFIAQFFSLSEVLSRFIVFAEVMGDMLIRKGKVSELKQLLTKVELSKGAVKFGGVKANIHLVKDAKKSGLKQGKGGREMPRTTIELALEEIKNKFQISEEEAIQIKEICEEVSEKTEIKDKIVANKDNEDFLKTSAEPKVQLEIKEEYIDRELWVKLEDPIYIEKGGIITLMGKAVINKLISQTA
jgi:type I restriction enzyme R subunit